MLDAKRALRCNVAMEENGERSMFGRSRRGQRFTCEHARGGAPRQRGRSCHRVVLGHDDFQVGAADTAALRGRLLMVVWDMNDALLETHHAGKRLGKFVLIKKTVFIRIERLENHFNCSRQL